MFDLGWTELLLIGIVALIVVGPKDLPGMFRTVGNLVGKAKRMAREFSTAMNDAADDAGMSDVQKTLRAAAKPMSSAMDEVKKSTESFTKQTMESGKPKLDPERQAMADKIEKKAADMATERKAAEAAADAGPDEGALTGDAAVAKPAARKPAAKKATTAKAAKAPAKTATKTPPAKKPATRAAPAKAVPKTAAKTAQKKPAASKARAPAKKAAPKTAAKSTAKTTKGKA